MGSQNLSVAQGHENDRRLWSMSNRMRKQKIARALVAGMSLTAHIP
jgi:hypothetical protein